MVNVQKKETVNLKKQIQRQTTKKKRKIKKNREKKKTERRKKKEKENPQSKKKWQGGANHERERYIPVQQLPPKDNPLWRSRRTPVRVLDGREAPGKFSLLYIRFPVLGFLIPVPRIFFPVPGFEILAPRIFFLVLEFEIPVPAIFFTAKFGHFLVTCFFFNYFFRKTFIKKNSHQKVTKLFSKKILKSLYPGFSRMALPN